MISRASHFMSNLRALNCRVSSSSSLGCDGLEDGEKSSTGSTSPLPMKFAQIRLTAALAKYGLSGLVAHAANLSLRLNAGLGGTLPDSVFGSLASLGDGGSSRSALPPKNLALIGSPF